MSEAFSYRDKYALYKNLETLKRRWLALHRCTITQDQFADLFLRSEIREAFRVAMAGAERGIETVCVTADVSSVHVTLLGRAIVPEGRLTLQDDTPEDLKKSMVDAIARQRETLIDFEKSKKLLEMLDRKCSTPQQVRYLWPAVQSLCFGEDLENLKARIGVHKAPRTPVSVPPEIRELCRYTSGIITAASILPDEPPVARPAGCIEITPAEFQIKDDALGTLRVHP
ncbi:hypothetical protein [Pseudolabrys sp.]|uniref:hypothetical protein n=1 Tax=Pseudolabrys sp. TaxID=1960880 RepID=UPI003D10D103